MTTSLPSSTCPTSADRIRAKTLISRCAVFGCAGLLIVAGTSCQTGEADSSRNGKADWVEVGVAKRDVTPEKPVLLAGYGGRTKESEGVYSRIWARALAIGREDPLVLVTVDNCGVPRGVVEKVAERVAKQSGIKRERFVICSTHTHSAPTLTGYATVVWGGRTTSAQAARVDEYTDWLEDQVVEVTAEALAAREACELSWGQGRVKFGGNRRMISDGKWGGFGFETRGPVDHSLPLLAARNSENALVALWVNYACHCTTMGGLNHIGGDWAGYSNEAIEHDHAGATALTTIGCGADIGPVPSGNKKTAQRHGRTIANEVARLLQSRLSPIRSSPRALMREVKLPYDTIPSREYWENRKGAFHEYHGQQQLKQLDRDGALPTHLTYPITTWSFGRDLAIVFLAGEVVVDYAVRLKRELDWQRLWINGWANDVPCYIPSKRVLAEGGYEADFSMVYYNRPTRFAPEVEDVIVGTLHEMLGRDFAPPANTQPSPFHRHPVLDGVTMDEPPAPSTEEWVEMMECVRGFWLSTAEGGPSDVPPGAFLKAIEVGRNGFLSLKQNDGAHTTYFDFSGGQRMRPYIRQQKKGVRLHWKTAPVKDSSGGATFVFAGGLGWVSDPATEGFVLTVNGAQVLSLDVTQQPAQWVNATEDVELLYLPTCTRGVDSAGFFYLTVPSRFFAKDRSCVVGIESKGEGSRRWFALDLVQDAAAYQTQLRAALKSVE